jgi:hypothetical protein
MRALIGGLICLAVVACDKTYITVPTAPGQSSAGSPAATKHTVSFRVIGNATAAKVRYATPADGLAQVVTTLPYVNTFTTTIESLFLSLDATPTEYPLGTLFPFLGIQIVVDDVVFREATSQTSALTTLSVTGTWRAGGGS